MKVIEIEDGVSGYRSVVEHVLKHGSSRRPRGFVTLDAGPTTVVIHDVTRSLPLGVGRGVSRKVAAVEAVQLVGGFSDPDLVVRASDGFDQFREKDGNFHGAYGRRIKDQLPHIISKLRLDMDSRQAVVTLWDPFLDNIPTKKDYPCTVSLVFSLRDEQLLLTTFMRSNDVWLGVPYDWFQFTQLQQTVARILHTTPGPYTHIANSLHIYGQHLDAAAELKAPDPSVANEAQPLGFGHDLDTRAHSIMNRARALVHSTPRDITPSETWYRQQFELMGA